MHNTIIKLHDSCNYIRNKVDRLPEIAIVLGSGLGSLADSIENKIELPYDKVPNFPQTTVSGHAGKLIFGELSGRYIVAMKGRFHYYEGWDMKQVVFPIRVFKSLGIDNLILTNAAGGINVDFAPGDLMLIEDHIGFLAENPLRGQNNEDLGPRFPDMSQVYNKDLIRIAGETGSALNIQLKKGIYAYCKGPSFETPAEIKAMRILGADAVGMSTVPEAITARHMGTKILGISCITNMAAGIMDQPLTHEEVMETGKMVEKKFSRLICGIVENWK